MNNAIRKLVLTVLLSVFAFTGGDALAQSFGGAFEGMSNTDDPIQIEADSLEVIDGQGIAQFKGNVSVVQGTTVLTASSLKVFYFNNGGGSDPNSRIRKIEAGGGSRVAVRSGDNHATANQLVVDMQQESVTLRGDVIVSQGENAVNGCILKVDLKTNNATLHPCEAASQVGSNGRIKMIFKPKSNNN